jgi:hypothetical protein
MRHIRQSLSVLLTGLLSCMAASSTAIAESAVDPLLTGFIAPPDSAKPGVWWHWMNGNVSKEGIRLDLEWMHRVGIGGVQNFDVSLNMPEVTGRHLTFMTPQWSDAFRYAVTLADQLGMEFAIASAPGWSASGGPWVPVERSMKKLVWNETPVQGGSPFSGQIPEPSGVAGPFQNSPWSRPFFGGSPLTPIPSFYRDVALLAYRRPPNDLSSMELHSKATSSAGSIKTDLLWDNDFTTGVDLPIGRPGEAAWIQLDFGRLLRIRSMAVALEGNNPFASSHPIAKLQASLDGLRFRTIATVFNSDDIEQTVTFAAATGRYFRLVLPAPPEVKVPTPFADFVSAAPPVHRIKEWVLYTTPRVDHFEQKAGFFVGGATDNSPAARVAESEAISRRDVVDLSPYIRPNGNLAWEAPPGRWMVLRIGYSSLGTINHPASPEATGLEVDKLSRGAVKSYLHDYLSRYESILGSQLIGQHGIRAFVNDSWEAGAQNWSEDLPAQFARRRGYELFSWLPALLGRVVENSEATEQFLWDFRRTLGELVTDNYFDQIESVLGQRGLVGYVESHETGRAFLGDGMDAKRNARVPMSALWANEEFVSGKQGDADIRESASVAHLYGQNLVAAESMTAVGTPGVAYAFSPEDLKVTADREFIDGVNRLIIHTSSHQPQSDTGPGVTLGPYGQWFTRNETWADKAAPWLTYLSRSSYLLQQGQYVADVLYFYGQDSNITALFVERLPPIPRGYSFDFANDHALSTLTVHDGLLVAANGMHYRMLALDPRARVISLDVLKTIAQLAAAGAVVVGFKPRSTPSLADDKVNFQLLADSMWGRVEGKKHRYGSGLVFGDGALSAALTDLGLGPDFYYSSRSRTKAEISFVHRQLQGGDLYFISNPNENTARIEGEFRVSGVTPQIWRADTGTIETVAYRQKDHHILIPLSLEPHEALFVVFRHTWQQQPTSPVTVIDRARNLTGSWRLHFQPGRRAPSRTIFRTLHSWSESADPGIRYFSGTATYQTALNISASWLTEGTGIELDLGSVKDVAEVFVNGRSAGIVWKRPFRVNVTALLKPGGNVLAIQVTNLWPNRLIGDRRQKRTIAFTTYNPYTADSSLLPSGLLGPVVLLHERYKFLQHAR